MIQKISVNPKNKLNTCNKQQSFKGGLDVLTSGLQLCEKYPMVNVSVVDFTTDIAPRTAIDTVSANAFAGAETFRRESSGLITNCLIPSYFVYGVGKVVEKLSKSVFAKTGMSGSWATQSTLETLSGFYEQAQGATKQQRVQNYLKNIFTDMSGLDGNTWKSFAGKNLDEAVVNLEKAIFSNNKKETKELVKQAYRSIAGQTYTTETLRVGGKAVDGNLSSFLRDTVDLGKKFINDNVSENLSGFKKWGTKFINKKSLIGLGVGIIVAMSMQPINRWITRKSSGKKGAPIYKDFDTVDTHSQMKDEKGFLKDKLVAAGTMMGIAALSMMKKPSLKMLQFSGWFPSVDQCRWISSSAFASRMLFAEDKNELKEAKYRDIFTYLSLYFLGDYAAKGVASVAEKVTKNSAEPIKILNRTYDVNKKTSFAGKIWNWFKNTNLKAFDEIPAEALKTKKLRSVCQMANLGASMIFLGLLIPLYTRYNTVKSRRAKIAELNKFSIPTTNMRYFDGKRYRCFNSFKALKDVNNSSSK